METLYPDDAPIGQVKTPVRPFPALTGALNSRFPSGTDVVGLRSYVEKLGGSCTTNPAGQSTKCSIVESTAFCIQNSVVITAKTNDLNKIESIDAMRIFEGC